MFYICRIIQVTTIIQNFKQFQQMENRDAIKLKESFQREVKKLTLNFQAIVASDDTDFDKESKVESILELISFFKREIKEIDDLLQVEEMLEML
jgi:hypothetical protein